MRSASPKYADQSNVWQSASQAMCQIAKHVSGEGAELAAQIVERHGGGYLLTRC